MLFFFFNFIFFLTSECLFLPQGSETLHRQSESWTIHPEQLVLAAPTISE